LTKTTYLYNRILKATQEEINAEPNPRKGVATYNYTPSLSIYYKDAGVYIRAYISVATAQAVLPFA